MDACSYRKIHHVFCATVIVASILEKYNRPDFELDFDVELSFQVCIRVLKRCIWFWLKKRKKNDFERHVLKDLWFIGQQWITLLWRGGIQVRCLSFAVLGVVTFVFSA